MAGSRPGVYFHLDGAPRRGRADGTCHLTVELEPPGPERRAALWREALTAEGIPCSEALAFALATTHDLRAGEIREAARLTRWKALAAGRAAVEARDLETAVAEVRPARAGRVLFGG